MSHTYHPSTWEAKVERLTCVCGQPGLHSKYQASLGYRVKPISNKQTKALGPLQKENEHQWLRGRGI